MAGRRRFFMYPFIMLIGGLAYCALELSFRGRTHWSMMLAGGLCVAALFFIATESRAAVWKKWLAAGAVISTIEFITGAFVNLLFGLGVWDYSGLPFNLLGQISLLFTLIWILLSIPLLWIFERLYYKLGGTGYDGAYGD